jgi:hypothetical protein
MDFAATWPRFPRRLKREFDVDHPNLGPIRSRRKPLGALGEDK